MNLKSLEIPHDEMLTYIFPTWMHKNTNASLANNLLDFFSPIKFVDFSDWSFLFRYSIVLLLLYLYHNFIGKPVNICKGLGEVGYVTDPLENRKRSVNLIKRMRNNGDVPPAYPNGWYGIMESHRLSPGSVLPVVALGKNIAIFRDWTGSVYILDAYCPHLGANLAVGGQVVGDCLECPFHGWQFRGEDGVCVKIPYLDKDAKIPSDAKVRSYIVKEINKWIYMWFDAEGREPYWDIPEIEELKNEKWVFRGRTEHLISSHIQDIPENGSDMAHLGQVHKASLLAGVDLRYIFRKIFSFSEHGWVAGWSHGDGDEGHIGELKLIHTCYLFGIRIPMLDLTLVAKQMGPAFVYMYFESFFGKGMYFHNLTPVEPLLQKLVHNIYISWWVPSFITRIFMLGEAAQVERDIMIWNNKKYQKQPVYVKSKEDSTVAKHRRWYSQFYSENSPKINLKQIEGSDW